MNERRYAIYDVFTRQALSGNPLAVVFGADDLDTARMQAIAREFNLSETVFVNAPRHKAHAAALRIFTPGHELPFAGHPTVGAAVALVEERARPGEMSVLVLEEKVGDVRCAVSRHGGASFAEFDLPRLSAPEPMEAGPDLIAAALGLEPDDIGFDDHRPGLWSAGVPYVTVPVRGLEAMKRAAIDARAWAALTPATGDVAADPYIYCRETVNRDCDFHARMFSPRSGIAEDPATGSAVAALSGSLCHHDRPADGSSMIWIEQGLEMGRPSRIRLEMDVEGGAIKTARIGGHAVRVAQGVLHL